MLAMSWPWPTAEKIISTLASGSKWLESLKTLSLAVRTLQARNQQQAGVLINER